MDGEIKVELSITREDGAVFLLEAYLSGANHSFFFYSKKKKVAAQTTVYKEDLLFLVTRNQSSCSAGSAHLLERTDQ